METVAKLFEKHKNEYLQFHLVENKRSTRRDVNALLLLAEWFPRSGNLISATRRDEIRLDVIEPEISKLTEDQIIELLRCGVLLDFRHYLYMFVYENILCTKQ